MWLILYLTAVLTLSGVAHCFHDTAGPHHKGKSGWCWMPGHRRAHNSSRHESVVSCTPARHDAGHNTWKPHSLCRLYTWPLNEEGKHCFIKAAFQLMTMNFFQVKVGCKARLNKVTYPLVHLGCCGGTSQTCSWVRGHTAHPFDSSGPPHAEAHKQQSGDHTRNHVRKLCRGRTQSEENRAWLISFLLIIIPQNYFYTRVFFNDHN